jgi:uncharacterized membrane protein
MITGIYFNLVVVSVLSLGLGMMVITFLKTKIEEVVEDERISEIHEKSARTAFKILMPILGLTAVTLFYAGSGPFYFLRSLGIILGYVTCVGLGVYFVAYAYFKKRYGA